MYFKDSGEPWKQRVDKKKKFIKRKFILVKLQVSAGCELMLAWLKQRDSPWEEKPADLLVSAMDWKLKEPKTQGYFFPTRHLLSSGAVQDRKAEWNILQSCRYLENKVSPDSEGYKTHTSLAFKTLAKFYLAQDSYSAQNLQKAQDSYSAQNFRAKQRWSKSYCTRIQPQTNSVPWIEWSTQLFTASAWRK